MKVDWQDYDAFPWAKSAQQPFDTDARRRLEQLTMSLLEIPEQTKNWGIASPPGRFAATVIHIREGIPHKFAAEALSQGIANVGVKLFKPTKDAANEFAKLMPFHNETMRRLPGLPHSQVQRSLWAGYFRMASGEKTGVLVQEWIDGPTLDRLLASSPSELAARMPEAGELVRQILADIIFPLWGNGLIWWDIRDANWVFDLVRQKICVIDSDSLAAYATEIMSTSDVWTRREKGRLTALSRLRQTCLRIFEKQASTTRSAIQKSHQELWNCEVEPLLRRLGRDNPSDETVRVAIGRYLDGMSACCRRKE